MRPMSDENVRIEQATIEDLPALVDLLIALFSEEADFMPDAAKQERGLRLILEQPSRGRIFVLRNQLHIIGMINLLFTISTAEGGFVILLEDLIILPEHRGRGYGSMLIEFAKKYAKEKDFLRITLLTDKPNARSTGFYKQHGFVDSDMIPLRHYLHDTDA